MRNDTDATAGELVEFVWPRGVPVEWFAKDRDWWLMRAGAGGTLYDPLTEERALFRMFASTDPTKDGIAAFAQAYGTLGLSRPSLHPSKGVPGTFGIVGAESMKSWQKQIRAMAACIRLHEAGSKDLRRWLHLDASGLVLDGDEVPFSRAWHVSKLPRDLAGKPDVRRRRLAALWCLQTEINQHMLDHVTAGLFLSSDPALELKLAPKNLLGALWLQLAQAVSTDRQYRRCGACDRWFEVSPEGKRPEAAYCSTACRVRAYRDRKARGTTRGR